MKKISLLLALILVLSFGGCGKKDTDADNNVVQTENQTVEGKDPEREKVNPKKEKESKKEAENDGETAAGNISTAADLESKINRFNELEDGDPEKEQIREELEEIFANAEK